MKTKPEGPESLDWVDPNTYPYIILEKCKRNCSKEEAMEAIGKPLTDEEWEELKRETNSVAIASPETKLKSFFEEGTE